jgi:hypothetical protein
MATRKKSARVEAREYWELLSDTGKQRIAGELKQSPPRDDARNVADSGLGAGELALPVLKEVAKLARMSLIWTGRRPPELDPDEAGLVFDGLELLRWDEHGRRIVFSPAESGQFDQVVKKIFEASARDGGLARLNVLDREGLGLISRGLAMLAKKMRSAGAAVGVQNQVNKLQDKIDNARGSTFY